MPGVLVDPDAMAALCSRISALEENQDGSADIEYSTQAVYEYRDIWAEESGGTDPNSAEWSFGNGATGFMGLPIDAGWEVEAMYFQADTFAAQSTIQVDLVDYGNVPSNAAANTIASISLSSATDGGGDTNNAYKYEALATPVAIPVTGDATIIGFLTRLETGNNSDARVGARLRRKVGDFVVSVGTTTTTGPTLGTPANGALVSDNFQDGNGNAPFNLQVRNTTGNATNWQAVVTGPYSTIPNLNAGNYTLQTTDNGDGTYTHVFTGTTTLGGLANITITGDAPTPAGQGGTANVDLYIP